MGKQKATAGKSSAASKKGPGLASSLKKMIFGGPTGAKKGATKASATAMGAKKPAAKAAGKAAAAKPAPASKNKKQEKPLATKGKGPGPEKISAATAAAASGKGKALKAGAVAPEKVAKGKGKGKGAPKQGIVGAAARAAAEAAGEAVCREVACEGLATTGGYCRMHYIKNWKKIKRKDEILREGKLNQYIEELVAKYPDKYIEAIRQDLASDKDFAKVIYDLDLDESVDDFEVEGESVDSLIDTIKRDFDDEGEGSF